MVLKLYIFGNDVKHQAFDALLQFIGYLRT